MRCRRVPSDAPAWSWFTGWSDFLGQVVAGVDPVHGVGDAADRVADADRVDAVGAGTRVPGDPRFDCHTAGIPRARRGQSAGGIATDTGRGLPWFRPLAGKETCPDRSWCLSEPHARMLETCLPVPCTVYPVISSRTVCLRKCRPESIVTLQVTLDVPSPADQLPSTSSPTS